MISILDQFLHEPLPVELPRFDIFRSKIFSRLATDRDLSYDLYRAANITKH